MLETPECFWVITFVVFVYGILLIGHLLLWISSLKYDKEIRTIVKQTSKTLLHDLELMRIVVINHEPHLPLVVHKYLIDEIYIKLSNGVFGDVSFEIAGDQLFVSRDVEMYKNSFRGFMSTTPSFREGDESLNYTPPNHLRLTSLNYDTRSMPASE